MNGWIGGAWWIDRLTDRPGRLSEPLTPTFLFPPQTAHHRHPPPPSQYIGRLKDIHPPLEALQLDNKPSIIVDYRNKGGDELRLVNAQERIYLGRGTDW
jgi:hypothetical protein